MPGFAGARYRGQRGNKYSAAHQRERRRLTPIVNAGHAHCAQPICVMPNRWIQPGTPWALGHNDAGTAWIGPVHNLCNQRDAARRGGHARALKHGPWRRRLPTW